MWLTCGCSGTSFTAMLDFPPMRLRRNQRVVSPLNIEIDHQGHATSGQKVQFRRGGRPMGISRIAIAVLASTLSLAHGGRVARRYAPPLDQRPLKLPALRSGEPCPISTGRRDTVA